MLRYASRLTLGQGSIRTELTNSSSLATLAIFSMVFVLLSLACHVVWEMLLHGSGRILFCPPSLYFAGKHAHLAFRLTVLFWVTGFFIAKYDRNFGPSSPVPHMVIISGGLGIKGGLDVFIAEVGVYGTINFDLGM